MIRIAALALLFAIAGLLAANCRREERPLNESLRLTDSEVAMCKQRALSGDSDAAKRLWRFYHSVMLDKEEGDRWHKVYDGLREQERQPLGGPSMTPSAPGGRGDGVALGLP
jgi:hypothetical protein